jgi:hypothetical protein
MIDIVGHDIGAMTADSFTANHPDAIRKIALLGHYLPEEQPEALTELLLSYFARA